MIDINELIEEFEDLKNENEDLKEEISNKNKEIDNLLEIIKERDLKIISLLKELNK